VYTKLKWYYRAKDANNNFIREPHYAGGLRVKKIKDIDTELIPNTPNYKTYNETKFEYSGLTGQNRVDDYFIQTGMNSGRTVFSSDVIGQPSDFPSGYFYESVLTEKVDGVTLGGLRTLNVFEREYTNNAYSGKQSKTFIYMNGNILIDKTFYIYQFSKTDHDYNILGRLDYCYGSPVSLLGYDTPSQETFSIHEDRLVKQVNTQYFYDNQNNLTNSLTNISEFDYNQDELVSQRIDDARATELQNLSSYDANNYSINYDGDKTIAFYKYPRNYLSETLFQDFVNNKNLLSLPVSVIISKNNELVDGSFVLYDTSGNLKELYKYNKGLGTNSSGYNYIPSTYDLSTIFSVSDGKLIEAQQYLGTIKSYIWDITHTYLLAEITNASYSSIASQITSPLNLATLSDVQLTSEFQTLRQNNPNVQITSYTYDPLIGVTSVTDTRGYTMYYEYDDLNRLKHVKDKDGNILSENLYNYKN
jgi:YD repeat-containing protein